MYCFFSLRLLYTPLNKLWWSQPMTQYHGDNYSQLEEVEGKDGRFCRKSADKWCNDANMAILFLYFWKRFAFKPGKKTFWQLANVTVCFDRYERLLTCMCLGWLSHISRGLEVYTCRRVFFSFARTAVFRIEIDVLKATLPAWLYLILNLIWMFISIMCECWVTSCFTEISLIKWAIHTNMG